MADVRAKLKLVYPRGIVSLDEHYREAYAVLEALRRKHNTRAGDLSPAAHAYRAECRRLKRPIIHDILALRPHVRPPDWTVHGHRGERPAEYDPAHVLRRAGKPRWDGVDLRESLQTDLDAYRGEALPPPDPTEDLTTYTEDDSWDILTVTASTVTAAGVDDSSTAAVYKDHGVDNFFEFTHLVNDLGYTNYGGDGETYYNVCWAVANYVDYVKGWDDDSRQAAALILSTYQGAQYYELRRYEGGGDFDGGTDPYDTVNATITRSGTSLDASLYYDEARTNLHETLTIGVDAARKWRYVFAFNTGGYPTAHDWLDCQVSDLDLQGSGGGANYVEGAATLPATSGLTAAAEKYKAGTATIGTGAGVSAAATCVYEADATIAATSGLSAAGDTAVLGAATIAAQAALAAAGKSYPGGSLLIVAQAELSAAGYLSPAVGTTTIGGLSTLAAWGENLPFGRATIAATSGVSASGEVLHGASATVACQSALTASGTFFLLGAVTIDGQSLLSASGYRIFTPHLSLPVPTMRRVSWSADEEVLVLIDGQLRRRTTETQIDLPDTEEIRGYLEIADQLPDTLVTPLDEVSLAWTGDAPLFHLYRKPAGGSFALLQSLGGRAYQDGPLDDGTYRYKVVAEDAEGDQATSAVVSVTISSFPDPPSGLDYEFDSETGKLTLSWDASPSSDIATYRVRSSAGEATLNLTSAPVQDSADTTYEQVFTNETGLYIFSVRAVDSDGNEEANISQAVAIALEDGEPGASPAAPRIVSAEPASGGKVEVSWLYDPADETDEPGAAHEARIYYDNGTGTVDLDSPLDTVGMSNPTEAGWWSWESGVLSDDTEYAFVVRVATDAHPDGIESQNTDEHTATPNSDLPSTPTLTAEVV